MKSKAASDPARHALDARIVSRLGIGHRPADAHALAGDFLRDVPEPEFVAFRAGIAGLRGLRA